MGNEAPGNDSRQASRDRLLERIAAVLVCPDCKTELDPRETDDEIILLCARCSRKGYRRGDQFVLGGFDHKLVRADWLNRIKESAKRRLGRFYPLAIRLISPVYGRDFTETFIRTFEPEDDLIVDLGSGTASYEDRVACIDGVGYANVHVVADLENLCLRSDSLAGAISVGVLEHVPDPQAHVREIRRVLQPGGRVLCFIPFIQGYHASPHDYQRYTKSGMRELFKDFELLDLAIGAGPTSGFVWILQEWLALIFSFGSTRLYRWLVPLTWILSPLKYLDIILARHPASQSIASGFVIQARKA